MLARSGVDETNLDFVVPVPVGASKVDVLEGMAASRYHEALLCADEISDYRAAGEAGYRSLIGSYGFDTSDRLLQRGAVPPGCLYDTPGTLADTLRGLISPYERDARTYDAREPLASLCAPGRATVGAR